MCATAAERAEWDVGENSPAGTKVRAPWSSLQPSSLGGSCDWWQCWESCSPLDAHMGPAGGSPMSHGSGQALEQKVGRRRWF